MTHSVTITISSYDPRSVAGLHGDQVPQEVCMDKQAIERLTAKIQLLASPWWKTSSAHPFGRNPHIV